MGRSKNDGRGRIGGRAKGTPNKPKITRRQWAAALVDRNRAQFEEDLQTLEPAQRAAVMGPIIAAVVSCAPIGDAQIGAV